MATWRSRKKNLLISTLALLLLLAGTYHFVGSRAFLRAPPPEPPPPPEIVIPEAPPAVPTSTSFDFTVDDFGLSKGRVTLNLNRGKIVVRLFAEKAPLASRRFVQLCQQGFYNGMRFHRRIDKFLVQTGDPTGTGLGGTGEKIPFEENDLKHEKGSVGLAMREGEKFGDSQFYIITHFAQPYLDGRFTLFGRVVDGVEILDGLERGDVIESVRIENQTATSSVSGQ
jgi:cyclophilin family peptidyl-prolyl cis-trans isomerase